MSDDHSYSGFFLSQFLGTTDGKNLMRVACFKSGTSFRKMLILKTSEKRDFKYGEIIHFWPANGILADDSLIVFREKENIFIHEETIENRIVHTEKRFIATSENLPSSKVYKHPILGDMIDTNSLMAPGKYNFIMFEVHLKKNETAFELKIFGGERLDASIDLKVTDKWDKVGTVRLVRHSDTKFLSGLRPVFQLCDNTRTMLFKKLRNDAPVIIIKQMRMKNGQWKVDPRFKAQEATLFADTKENRTIAALQPKYRHHFEHVFKVNDIFRFVTNCETYQQKYEVDNPDYLKLQEVIDSNANHSAELQQIKDKQIVRDGLNPNQRLALEMALNEKRKVVCMQGGPGTGKTHILSILLCKLIKAKKQVIVLAPTNEALNVIKGMTEQKLREKRISCPENGLLDIDTFNNHLSESEEAREGTEMMRIWHKDFTDHEITREELDEFREDHIQRTELKGEEMMKDVRVLFSTIASSFIPSAMRMKNFEPCMCIIDEASQVSESQMFPASLSMKRIIIAGDIHGLRDIDLAEGTKSMDIPPSVLDRIIANKNFYSLMMLEDQYRCPSKIIEWSNKCVYNKNLANTTDKNLNDCFATKPLRRYWKLYAPFVLVDTSTQTNEVLKPDTYEQVVIDEETGDQSFINKGEAHIAIQHYEKLRFYGVRPENIAIITPYSGQVKILEDKMSDYAIEENDEKWINTKIGTIDSVQGQEYDAVIFSMVRSNPKFELGIAADLCRLNLAFTRAKRHFMFIGNAFLLVQSKIHEIRKIYEIAKEGAHHFHPNKVSGNESEEEIMRARDNKMQPRGNFGIRLKTFMEHTNDPEMLLWCKRRHNLAKTVYF